MDIHENNLELPLHLITSLKVKNNVDIGSVLSDGSLWKFLPVSSLNLKETVNCISVTQKVLQTLLDGLQKSMAVLEARESSIKGLAGTDTCPRAPPRAQGILSLPNEIICMIARDANDKWKLIRLSQTCKQLREIILSCPDLWSQIDSIYSNSFNEMFLRRSQSSLLDVTIAVSDSDTIRCRIRTPSSWRNFISLILRHSHRWKKLEFVVGSLGPSSSCVLAQLSEIAISLPRLKSFEYKMFLRVHGRLSNEALLAIDDLHFYCSWSMPNLSEFEFEDFIPRAIQLAATTIKVDFTTNDKLNTALLLNFLRANPQVQILLFDIMTCTIEPTESSVTLDGVETLSIQRSYSDLGDMWISIRNLMSILKLPNVANLKFHMDAISFGEHVNMAINSLLSGQERFEKLAKLELEIIRLSGESYSTGRFLTKLPNLKELTIDAHYEDTAAGRFWDDNIKTFKLPNLDYVKLDVDSNFFDEDLIHHLLDATKVDRLELVYYPSFLPRRVQKRIKHLDTVFVWDVKK